MSVDARDRSVLLLFVSIVAFGLAIGWITVARTRPTTDVQLPGLPAARDPDPAGARGMHGGSGMLPR
jgi:hypothetical protein